VGKQSQAWKDLEREVAEELNGERVLRGADFSKEGVDVEVKDFPGLRIDAKYRAAWSHTSYLKEVVDKYVKEPGDIALLVTKKKRQRGAIACLSLKDFGTILNSVRYQRARILSLEAELQRQGALVDRTMTITNPRIVHRVLAPLDGGPHSPGGSAPHRGDFLPLDVDASSEVGEGAPMTPPVIGTAPGSGIAMGPPGQETGEPKKLAFGFLQTSFKAPALKEVPEQER
jgi:hypothetical protein